MATLSHNSGHGGVYLLHLNLHTFRVRYLIHLEETTNMKYSFAPSMPFNHPSHEHPLHRE